MALFVLDNTLSFPAPHLAEPGGLLAIGGDLSTERLLLAYRRGIFPWYEGEHILWWCPSPRFVLFPEELKVNKNVNKLLKRNEFEFTVNKAFRDVIHHCKKVPRAGQQGTWITDEVERAYITLHKLGYAHSAEVWKNDALVGGLYGVRLGKVFYGESMFSHASNASRYAFIKYIQESGEHIKLIDCQVHTEYLESMGARMIPRKKFLELLDDLIGNQFPYPKNQNLVPR